MALSGGAGRREAEDEQVLRSDDWLRQARGDQETAEVLFRNGRWDWCCFASQQSAEKYLKAALDARRADCEGHSLPALSRRLEPGTAVPEGVGHACRVLNRFYIPTRYPDVHQEGAPVDLYDEKDAGGALEELRVVAGFVEGLVRPPTS